MSADDRYPLAVAALHRILGRGDVGVVAADAGALAAFRLGPAVLRAPPPVRAGATVADPHHAPDPASAEDAGSDLLGELVDMVLVGADDSATHVPEVHLQFKAEVLGGLMLRLQKEPEGLVATFVVADASARRAVVDQVEALLDHLRLRGFAVLRHRIELSSSSPAS
jgi:hypothetical protein